MAKETEKKYTVTNNSWTEDAYKKTLISQGYLHASPNCTVRIRTAGDKGYLTIKGRTHGISRDEFEYEIPLNEAEFMLKNMTDGVIIEKERFEVRDSSGFIWSIDRFHGLNEGLIIAEAELSETQPIFPESLPDWIGIDISGDKKYFNSSLSSNPFANWNSKNSSEA